MALGVGFLSCRLLMGYCNIEGWHSRDLLWHSDVQEKHPGIAKCIVCVFIQPPWLPDANRWRVSELKQDNLEERHLTSQQLKQAETMADGRIWS